MLLVLLVTLAPPIVIGSLLARTFLPAYRPALVAWLLNVSLGAGLGVGVLSLLYFLVKLLLGPSSIVYGAVEITALLASAGACRVIRDRAVVGEEPRRLAGWLWLLPVATGVCLILAVAQFADSSAASPYGNWDAWSIWNLRAKLLAQPNAAWRDAFSPVLNQQAGAGATHGDYPLLLSAYIARCWSLTSSIGDVTAPIAVAGLFSLATVGLLIGGLAILRGWTTALTGGIILLGTAEFLHNSAWQLADVPVGFFYLAAFVLFLLLDAAGGARRVAVVAGIALGCAAWTKDEGMFFAVFAMLALTAWQMLSKPGARLRTLALLAAGAVLPLAVSIYFKIFLAPQGIWAPLTLSAAASRLVDASRYALIFGGLWNEWLDLGRGIAHPALCLAVLAACLGVSREWLRRPGVLAACGLLLAITTAYFFSYVVTPLELAWHLSTSAGRLMVQLVPATIFLALAVCRSAEETALPIEEPKRAVRAGKKKTRRAPTAKLGR